MQNFSDKLFKNWTDKPHCAESYINVLLLRYRLLKIESSYSKKLQPWYNQRCPHTHIYTHPMNACTHAYPTLMSTSDSEPTQHLKIDTTTSRFPCCICCVFSRRMWWYISLPLQRNYIFATKGKKESRYLAMPRPT